MQFRLTLFSDTTIRLTLFSDTNDRNKSLAWYLDQVIAKNDLHFDWLHWVRFMNENSEFVITTIVNSLLTFVLWPNLFPIQFILNTRIKRYPWRIWVIQFSIGALKSFEPTKGTKKTSILSEGAKKTPIRLSKGTKNLNSGKKNKKKTAPIKSFKIFISGSF